MGSLKFLGTIVLKFKSIVFKFKSIYSGIILFFREIKTLFSATSVEGATSTEKFIYPIVNLIRIWFEYVKDHLPEIITIITILIIVVVIFSIWNFFLKKDKNINN